MLAFSPGETVSAHEERDRFFIAPIIEVSYYGLDYPSIGYGLSFGYGGSSAIGLRSLFTQSLDNVINLYALEITVFFRFNFFSLKPFDYNPFFGPYIQLNTGFCVLYKDSEVYFPAEVGTISAGFSAGWRFAFGRTNYVEPYLRGGYPYYGGIGVSVGVRL